MNQLPHSLPVFKIFYQHDLTTYSTVNVEHKHDAEKNAVGLFTKKYPSEINLKFIHVIELNRYNKPLHYTTDEHRTISKKSMTKQWNELSSQIRVFPKIVCSALE